MHTLPQPATLPVSGHLQRWGGDPLSLLHEGAAISLETGKTFALKLGLPAVVGYSPEWNKLLLSDLDTFRSAGSFSAVVPYLAGGVILTDAGHRERRGAVNPPFGKRSMESLRERIRAALRAENPDTTFDALAWADRAVLRMLNAAYFSSDLDAGLLHAFLAPLRHAFPVPAIPRPLLFARMNRALDRLAHTRLTEQPQNQPLCINGPNPAGCARPASAWLPGMTPPPTRWPGQCGTWPGIPNGSARVA